MMKGCICALPVDVEYLLRRQNIQIVVYEAVGYRIYVEVVLLHHRIVLHSSFTPQGAAIAMATL